MPIANCIVNFDLASNGKNLIDLWGRESGISTEHMTINVLHSKLQLGQNYSIMANLYLPSLWSKPNINVLQVGLSNALSKCFQKSIDEVHVMTHIVDTGMVVENGVIQTW